MTKDEMLQVARTACFDVLDRNRDLIDERVKEAFCRKGSDNKILLTDALSSATGLCLSFIPELSAVVTAEMLVALGLVSLEDA